MIDKAWFTDWFNSPYYHLLYQHRDEKEAEQFIKKLIVHLKPTVGMRMLDIACGKGRHSMVLADMGFDITGIDLSEASIKEAKLAESDTLHFYQHDMRRVFRINYFDYAFNFFTSFGYFKTRREHDNAIRMMSDSIKPGGILVIDYLNVHFVESQLEPIVTTAVDDIKFHISKWHTEEHFFKQIQITDQEHTAPRHLYTERVAKFSLGDFNDMLSYQHMQIVEVFGNYQLGDYDVKISPRMIIVAQKMRG
jgi:2-polyprenyl-3-methyl-5-hydroxy-6-metoxy-1,4-benzoquinol methylase